ncbi:MAG: hypothetical protein ABR543_10175 [Gemmatimonadaceae bacterium]
MGHDTGKKRTDSDIQDLPKKKMTNEEASKVKGGDLVGGKTGTGETSGGSGSGDTGGPRDLDNN